MSLRIIIPARYGSTRFPGKPLVPVAGIPLLQRVWALACSVADIPNVVITTDDQRIAEFCRQLGANCAMTSPAINNGTERTLAALKQLSPSINRVINLQGDAVLTPPWVIHAVMQAMEQSPEIGIFTPAMGMTPRAYQDMRRAKMGGEVGGTTVTFNLAQEALYFSKSVIPFVRDGVPATVYRHIGLYGYRRAALEKLVSLAPTPLEQAEKLEQLRALEHGMKIRVTLVDYRGRSHVGIDTEQDLQRAEALIADEGELLPTYDGSYHWPGAGTL